MGKSSFLPACYSHPSEDYRASIVIKICRVFIPFPRHRAKWSCWIILSNPQAAFNSPFVLVPTPAMVQQNISSVGMLSFHGSLGCKGVIPSLSTAGFRIQMVSLVFGYSSICLFQFWLHSRFSLNIVKRLHQLQILSFHSPIVHEKDRPSQNSSQFCYNR